MEPSQWPTDPADRVRAVVERILDQLELDGEVEITEDDDVISAQVDESTVSFPAMVHNARRAVVSMFSDRNRTWPSANRTNTPSPWWRDLAPGGTPFGRLIPRVRSTTAFGEVHGQAVSDISTTKIVFDGPSLMSLIFEQRFTPQIDPGQTTMP